MKEPEAIEMTPQQIHDLRVALLGQAELAASQREILIGLLDNHLWLQFELQAAKLSIHRLKMVFGIKSEKKRLSISEQTSPPTDDSVNAQQPSESQLSSPEESRSLKPRNRKGIGRRSANEYTGADIIHIEHSELSRGDYCPDELCDGKVYLKKRPGKVVRVSGNTMFAATVYRRDTYECNLCKSVYPAALPEGVSETSKYDTKAKVIAAANRIQMGIAMYRMAIMTFCAIGNMKIYYYWVQYILKMCRIKE